ncbi:TNS2 protein, partial [Menura novaehollandiae]|nr:TNS2 protein [Menura novaehollandiae]
PQPRPLPAPHTFRERSLRRGGPCGGCGTPLGPHGLVCRVCKVAAHKRCESKVTSPCQAVPPPELVRGVGPRPPQTPGQDPGPPKYPPRAGPCPPGSRAPPDPTVHLQRRNTAPVRRSERV